MSKENEFADYRDDRLQETENNKSNAYRTNNADSLTKTNKSNLNPIREGQPMGGQNFGKNNNTPSGDDKNNPSRNAGYTNEYFRRTEPSEEHPEDTNFKPRQQEGEPDYDSAQPYAQAQAQSSKTQINNNKDTDTPNPQQAYTKGTADNDGNISRDIPDPDNMPNRERTGPGDNIL